MNGEDMGHEVEYRTDHRGRLEAIAGNATIKAYLYERAPFEAIPPTLMLLCQRYCFCLRVLVPVLVALCLSTRTLEGWRNISLAAIYLPLAAISLLQPFLTCYLSLIRIMLSIAHACLSYHVLYIMSSTLPA